MSGIVATSTAGEALGQYAQAQLHRAIACFGWRGGRVHAGVHQGRKALRRARAVLALGGEPLGAGAPLVDRELRRICRGLSAERDAQALVEVLDRLLAEGDGAAECLRRARRAAAAARARVLRDALGDDPGLARRRERLGVLLAALPALHWSALDEAALRDGIERSQRRLVKAARRAHRTGKDADWHRLRRRVRRLAQQCSALEACGFAALAAARPDRRLAAALGEAQDFALLIDRCGGDSPFRLQDRAPIRVLARAGLDARRSQAARRIAAAAAKRGHSSTQPMGPA